MQNPKSTSLWENVEDTDVLNADLPFEEKIKRLTIQPDILLEEGEICYYCKDAYVSRSKNIFATERFKGTLYITNIRMILNVPLYGFDFYVSKITQITYKKKGLRVLVGSSCYSVETGDVRYIMSLIEFMNKNGGFKDEKWLRQQQKRKSVEVDLLENVDTFNGMQFEKWCSDLLISNGFVNVTTTKASGDQGVDILAEKGEIKYAIQCKCYSNDLGNSPVQEVHAGKSIYRCHIGVVMTNRHFTNGAKELAAATGVLLWDREKLLQMMSNTSEKEKPSIANKTNNMDPLLSAAINLALEEDRIGTSMLQRKLLVGYGRACKLIDDMETMGIVSEDPGTKLGREVTMSKSDILKILENSLNKCDDLE